MSRKYRRAFTVIELLVVVVIMAVLAGLIIPFALSRSRPRETREPAPAAAIAQSPPRVAAYFGDTELPAPKIISSTIALSLRATPILDSTEVRSRYRARFRGEFLIEAISPRAETVELFFPFPAGASEIRDVSMRVRDAQGEFRELPGTNYLPAGINYRGPANFSGPLVVAIEYGAAGTDRLQYDLLGRTRSGKVRFSAEVEDGSAIVPAESLEPSSATGARVVWSFEKVITDRPIILEIPARSSPLGRAIYLLRLAAIGVLLFGAGYWYLGEGLRPGHLREFRWSHFLLLALNYSLYFAVCGVLLFWSSPAVAIILAGLIALPLLIFHVGKIAGWTFALRQGLPLALYSLITTVGAAFLEESRSLIFLAAGVVAVAFLTLTHARYVAARKKLREERELAKRPVPPPPAPPKPVGTAYCAACGAGTSHDAKHCAACGVIRPLTFSCRGCGGELRMPWQLLKKSWSAQSLCCEKCGQLIQRGEEIKAT